MIKRILAILLAAIMLFAVVGCDNNNDVNDNGNNNSHIDETDDNGNNATVETNKPNVDVSGKITEEMVRNHKVATASDFEYVKVKDGIKINKYIGNDPIVVIPDTIDGYPVVEIKQYIFANESTVKGVFFPASIKVLKNIFPNNINIQVVIAEGLESLLDATMLGCKQLHTMVLGANLKELGICCINGCKELEKVYISPLVTEIDSEYALTVFYSCPKLTVQGEAGSYIESFCAEYNIPFEAK